MMMVNVISFNNGILDTNDLFVGEDVNSEVKDFFVNKIKELNPNIIDEELEIALQELVYDNMNGLDVVVTYPEIHDGKNN